MIKKPYIRDKRSPLPKNETVSITMSKNKASNTKPEIKVRNILWHNGFKGYRISPKNLPGKPDICFVGKKIAIFINGCFWHRCPTCNLKLPKNNTEFWENKFFKNVKRDKEKIKDLKLMGFKVITVWECELKKDKMEETIKDLILKIRGNEIK